MKYIDINKIQAEIERRKKYQLEQFNKKKPDGRPNDGWAESLAIMGELEDFLSFLDTLEESVSEDLEEAVDDHIRKVADAAGHPGWDWETQDIAEAFKAEAEWQARQLLKSSPLPEDTVIFQKGVEEGERLIMEGAVEGEVYKFGEIAYVKEHNNAELTKYLSQFNNGDKVKIIVVHETDIR